MRSSLCLGGGRFQALTLELRAEVYRYLFAYWRSRRGAGDPEVERVKGLVQVPARLLTSRRADHWLPADQVYLSTVWHDDDRLERLYEDCDRPFLFQVRGLDIEARHGTCPVHGKKYRQLRRSVSLDGFAEFVERGQADRLLLLYDLVADNWVRVPKAALQAEVCCYRRDCPQYARSHQVSSFFNHLLQNAKWIPARTNLNGTPQFELRQPRHCWFVSSGETPTVRNLLPTPPVDAERPEHQDFCQHIGMRFIERATQSDLVEMLRRLPLDYPDPNIAVYSGRRSVPRALGAFSRWIIGRINNLLAPLSATERSELAERVPLIALKGDALCYVHPPDPVFLADDRYHTVRWRAHLPFAQMDDNCQDAARLLGVNFISQNVDEMCVPGRQLEAESSRLESRYKAARPYMLAMVKEQRESELQDAALYLTRLDLIVVDHLVVHRRLTIPPYTDIADRQASVYLEVSTGRRTGSAGRAPRSGTLYVRQGKEEHFDLMAGPIAEFIRMPSLADAFVVLLDRGGKEGRLRFLQTRGLTDDHVQDMRSLIANLGFYEEPQPEEEDPGLDDYLVKQIKLNAQTPTTLVAEKQEPERVEVSDPDGDNDQSVGPVIEFPPLELAQVQVVRVLPEDGLSPEARIRHLGRRGRGGKPDWERDNRLREAYGEQGERVVKLLEVERLRALGISDPEAWVQWRREQGDFTADHDIESRDRVAGHWMDIVIEVKATPGYDFRFPMSRDELLCAEQWGDHYRLYRVVDILSSTPRVYVFGNPFLLWQQGRALIEPRDTYVVLPDPRRKGGPQTEQRDDE